MTGEPECELVQWISKVKRGYATDALSQLAEE